MVDIINSYRKPIAKAIKCYLVKKFIPTLGNIGLLFKAKRGKVNIIIFVVFMLVLLLESHAFKISKLSKNLIVTDIK